MPRRIYLRRLRYAATGHYSTQRAMVRGPHHDSLFVMLSFSILRNFTTGQAGNSFPTTLIFKCNKVAIVKIFSYLAYRNLILNNYAAGTIIFIIHHHRYYNIC